MPTRPHLCPSLRVDGRVDALAKKSFDKGGPKKDLRTPPFKNRS